MFNSIPLKKYIYHTLFLVLLTCNISCSNEDDSSSTEENAAKGNCIENGAKITIAGNHSHTLNITIQDITNGTQKNYTLDGATGHTHMLTITAEHFTILKTNNAVTLATSTNAGHTHAVTIGCKE